MNIAQDTDKFFEDLEEQKENLLKAYNKTIKRVNSFLEKPDNNGLLLLIEYIDNEKKKGRIKYFSRLLRLCIMIEILKLEQGNNIGDFLYGVNDFDSLLNKYIKIVFYLRRIEMDLSGDLVKEGFEYINDNQISPLAIFHICKYEKIYNIGKVITCCCDAYRNMGKIEEGVCLLLCAMYAKVDVEIITEKAKEWGII